MLRSLLSLLVIVFCWQASPAAAATGTGIAPARIALVIGNGGYRHAPVLPNAVNDGRDIAEKLRGLDFEVYEGIDLDRTAMLALLEQFAGRIQGAEVGLFFFSGHALQVDNVNYLVPIDALVQSRSDIETALVDLPQILGRMEGASPVSIVMLDACRDNPLPGGAAPVLQQSVGTGLARVGARAGMLVAFSTAPGAVAVDSVGNAANSPFTLACCTTSTSTGWRSGRC